MPVEPGEPPSSIQTEIEEVDGTFLTLASAGNLDCTLPVVAKSLDLQASKEVTDLFPEDACPIRIGTSRSRPCSAPCSSKSHVKPSYISKRAIAASPAGAPTSTSSALLKASFLPKNGDIVYCGLAFGPCVHWFKGLVDASKCKATKAALEACRVPFVETLCKTARGTMFLRACPRGTKVSTGNRAVEEFLQYAETWSRDAASNRCEHPILIQKQPGPQSLTRNTCEVITVDQARFLLQREGVQLVLQRFVPARANNVPSILRIAWRDSLAPRGFRLESQSTPTEARQRGLDLTSQWVVSSDSPAVQAHELRIVSTKAVRIAQKLAQLTQNVFQVCLSELTVDLLQDDCGAYQLLQVKSFAVKERLSRKSPVVNSESQLTAHTDTTLGLNRLAIEDANFKAKSASSRQMEVSGSCSMCSCTLPRSKLIHVMTPKMMVETEHHLRKHGVQLFHVGRLRAMQLSQTSKACDACWALFLAVDELSRVEARFARTVVFGADASMHDEALVPFNGVLASLHPERLPTDQLMF